MMQTPIHRTLALLKSRGLLSTGGSLFGSAFTGSFRLTDQCQISTEPTKTAATPIAVSLSWSSPAAKQVASPKAVSPKILSVTPAVRVVGTKPYPYQIKERAAAALRIKGRALVAAAKAMEDAEAAELKVKQRNKAIQVAATVKAGIKAKALQGVKLRLKLKAAADKEKERAKVQKVKDVETQRKALLVKRAPNAYTLFVKDRFPALSHLPREGRFLIIGKEYKELTADSKQRYVDTASKLKAEVHAKRAVIKAAARVRRPPSAYMLFFAATFKEMRAANPTKKAEEIVGLIGRRWSGLDESKKQPFRTEAASKKAAAV